MARIGKQKITRWLDANGKRVQAGTPGARKEQTESEKYYAFDLPGQPRGKAFPLGTARKDAAQKELARLLKLAEDGALGQLDPAAEARDLLLEDLRKDFMAHLEARGKTSPEQIGLQDTRLQATFDGCGWKRLRDLDGEEAARYLARRRQLPRKKGGISLQTSNYYRTHLRAFARWLMRTRRLKDNPFAELEAVNADEDRKHLRRDLDPEEVARLLETTQKSAWRFRGLTGVDRGWLYLLGSGTGLRAKELGSLTPAHFDLDGDPPTVQVARRRTKNKKGATQPLPVLLVPALKAWLAGKGPADPLWPGTWRPKAAKMLRHDLAACNPPIPYVVQGIDGPEYADLHSLRHTYVSMMSRTAPIKVAQVAARHGSLQVTERYAHARLDEIALAVNALPLGLKGQTVAQPEPSLLEQVQALAVQLTAEDRAALLVWLQAVEEEAAATASNHSSNREAG